MLRLITRIVVLISLVVPFVWVNNCKAGIETTEQTSTGDIRLLTSTNPLIVNDNKIDPARYPSFDWSIVTDNSIKNAVYVRIVNPELINFKTHYEITLSIQYFTDQALTASTSITVNKILKVDYDPLTGKSYKAIDTYNFTGAYGIRVVVTSVKNVDFPNDTSTPLALQVSASETVDRTYTIAPDVNVKMTATRITGTTAGTHPGSEQLSLGWGFTPGAEEYDVEWATIDDNSENIALVKTMLTSTPPTLSTPSTVIVNFDPLFRNNATRITTEEQTYNISLMYNSTYILVRMRYVHYTTEGIRIVGDWNYTNQINNGPTYQYNVWTLNWHEPSLNWQYSAAFAEEGKKKEVVSYFDGTLRNRQTVTINNSDQVAIAQENIYDEFGRSTASILPAPFYESTSVASSLHFIPNFNKDALGNAYSIKNIFSSATSQECEKKPDGMDVSSGASKYYSSSNELLSLPSNHRLYKKYNFSIPNANAYPFSVQQYTNDNTGRVKIQGGVGDNFQADASGKSNTTKYYYGKPEQWELDQLFGNDAGYADHYLKNMVIDPNGQGSISYINASGKTVATALTALNPASLDPLSSLGSNINFADVQILKPEQFKFTSSDLKITGTTTYVSSSPQNDVTFSYNIPQIIDHFPEIGTNVCSSCYYTLAVNIVNDCGDPVETDFKTDIIGMASSGTTCIASATQTKSIIAKFNKHVGTYYITFQLSFDKKVIDILTDRYINQQINNTVLQTQYDYIKTNFIKDIDFSGSYKDCRTCLMLLGTHADFKAVVTKKFTDAGVTINQADFNQWIDGGNGVTGIYDVLKSNCTALISTCDFHTCDRYKTMMEQDVSPGGQYALFYSDGSPIEPEINVLKNNFDKVFGSKNAPATIPKEDQFTKSDGTIMSPYDDGFDVPTMVKYWKPSWAQKFLSYHPESCKYEFCQKMETYENWDEKVKQLYTKATDISNITNSSTNQSLAYDYTSGDWLLAGDPFFNTPTTADFPTGYDYKQKMSDDLKKYSSNVLYVSSANFNDPPNTTVKVLGLTQYIDYSIYRVGDLGTTQTSDKWNADALLAADACRVKDKEWSLYKEFYFQLKQKYYDKLRRTATCSSLSCDIGQLIEAPLSGSCPDAQNFTIVANGPSTAGMQHVLLTYTGSKFDVPVEVKLYYPSSVTDLTSTKYNASLITKIYLQNSATAPYGFDIPAALPPSTVHVANVSCVTPLDKFADQISITEEVTSNTVTGMLFDYVSTGGFGHKYVYFHMPYQKKKATITLQDYLGNTITASHTVTVNLKYRTHYEYGLIDAKWDIINVHDVQLADLNPGNVGYSASYAPSFSTMQIQIQPGESSGSIEYYSLTYVDAGGINGFYPEKAVDISCIENFSGAGSIIPWLTTCPEPASITPACLAYQNKESRFPQVGFSNSSIGKGKNDQVQANNHDDLTAQVTNSCTSNAEIWMQKLAPGLAGTSVDKAALKARLIALCEAGGDFTHPFGVSALPATAITDPKLIHIPAATAVGDKNFGDVIQAFVPGKFTDVLNPWLINSPYPYDTPPNSTGTFINVGNSTVCTQLNNLYTAYNATLNGVTPTDQDFYNYLVKIYGAAMVVSLDDLTTLRSGCACTGYFLNHEVQVAPFLDLKAQVTLADYTAAKTDMNAQFLTNITTSPNYPTILTNYINQRYGFFYSYKDYMAFEAKNSAVLYNIPSYTNITPDPYASVKSLLEIVLGNGVSAYNKYINDARDAFRAHYITICSQAQASVNLKTTTQNYHYTLYYYDQADNLIRTVPPDGVNILTNDKLQQVETFRALSASSAGAIYNGPTINSDPAIAFSKLSDLLNSPLGGAIEMWFNPNSPANINMVQKTPDGKFIFQLTTSNNVLRVDIYNTTDNGVTYTDANYGAIDMSALQPLQPWIHLVIQSANFTSLSAGALKLNVNGADLPIISGLASVSAGTVTNITSLKHMRLYNRYMAPLEILLNSANTTFNPINTDANWYRFNVPAAGSEGTLGDNSTLETAVTGIYPNHNLVTTYQYNSTNQVVQQNTPDAGTSTFWYDMLSRLTASQNAKQASATLATDRDYSYTVYDEALGRITEVGQKSKLTSPLSTTNFYLTKTDRDKFLADGTNKQITQTFYDGRAELSPNHPTGLAALPEQENLRKRVSASTYRELSTDPVQQATYYNYDLDGNVKTLWQQIGGLTDPTDVSTLKRVDYEYDLVSGKVNFVRYQDNKPDNFYYKYDYDAENRLTEAWSGTQAAIDPFGGSTLIPGNARLDAHYEYYRHGPLARIELGDIYGKVQGIDYAYTLQGWLKGVNSTTLSATDDIGNDGLSTAKNSPIPVDAFGYALYYYGDKDYTPIGGTNAFVNVGAAAGFKPLYNGNIAASSVNIPIVGKPMLYVYGYDQLNRLTRQDAFNWVLNSNVWTPVTIKNDYQEKISYSANGNILDYTRNGNTITTPASTGVAAKDDNTMDQLHYAYNKDSQGNLLNNRLRYINDDVTQSHYNGTDLQGHNGTDSQAATADNYQYDAIGNLIHDDKEGINNVDWTVYGKIRSISKTSGNITYTYDAAGHRVSKTVGPAATATTTYYVRDAQGNTLGVYDQAAGGKLFWREQHLYGSSRLGIWAANMDVSKGTTASSEEEWKSLGHKYYELNNHLGNVLATITDRVVPHYSNNTFDYNTADVASAQDYYPFGMLMPGRIYRNTADNGAAAAYYPCVLCDDFSSGTAGWNVGPGGGATVSYANGSLAITTTKPWSGVIKSFSTEIGQTYTVKYSIRFGSYENVEMAVQDDQGRTLVFGNGCPYSYKGDVMPEVFTFTAASKITYFVIANTYSNISDTFFVDNLTIQSTTLTTPDITNRLAAGYRYGFNGKENDNEVKQDANGNNIIGSQQDYGMRIYDPRLGKFLSVDPLTDKYPELTPYQFASNRPIDGVDLDGLEWSKPNESRWPSVNWTGDGTPVDQTLFVPQNNRKWESDVRKSDPRHADARIARMNKIGVVGGGSFLAIPFILVYGGPWVAASGESLPQMINAFLGDETAAWSTNYATNTTLTVAGGYAATKLATSITTEEITSIESVELNAGNIEASRVNKVSNDGSQTLANFKEDLPNVFNGIDNMHLQGAIKDMRGQPIVAANGRVWNHLEDILGHLRGLNGKIKTLNKLINSNSFSGTTLEQATKLRSNLQKTYDSYVQALTREANQTGNANQIKVKKK